MISLDIFKAVQMHLPEEQPKPLSRSSSNQSITWDPEVVQVERPPSPIAAERLFENAEKRRKAERRVLMEQWSLGDGKMLVFYSGDEWCAPCERVRPHAQRMMEGHRHMGVVRGTWDTDKECVRPDHVLSVPWFDVVVRNPTLPLGMNIPDLDNPVRSIQTSDADRLRAFVFGLRMDVAF